MLPLLSLHKDLSTAVGHNHKLSATGVVSSKKSMLEKLTKLITTRVVKVKGEAGADVQSVFKGLVEEVKRSPSREHCACASLCLVACVKAGGVEDAEGSYNELLVDFGEKKNSRVHAVVFEDAVGKIGGGMMLAGLTKFMTEGRGDFIKSECFR